MMPTADLGTFWRECLTDPPAGSEHPTPLHCSMPGCARATALYRETCPEHVYERPQAATCKYGHPRTPENVYRSIRKRDGGVIIQCKPCQQASWARRARAGLIRRRTEAA